MNMVLAIILNELQAQRRKLCMTMTMQFSKTPLFSARLFFSTAQFYLYNKNWFGGQYFLY